MLIRIQQRVTIDLDRLSYDSDDRTDELLKHWKASLTFDRFQSPLEKFDDHLHVLLFGRTLALHVGDAGQKEERDQRVIHFGCRSMY